MKIAFVWMWSVLSRVYWAAMDTFCNTVSLFVLPEGPHRGHPTTTATIAKLMKQLIPRPIKENIPAFPFSAHSTFQYQTTVSQICKATTWSSVHPFSKFYQVNFQASG